MPTSAPSKLVPTQVNGSWLNQANQSVRNNLKNGTLFISDLSAAWPPGKPAVHRQKCEGLLAAIDDLWQAYHQQTQLLQAAHFELGSQCVVGLHRDSLDRLTQFLNQLITVAAQQTGYDAAAAFVIDDHQQRLIQRIGVGNLFRQTLGSSRLISDSRADQQALLGSLVVMGSVSATAQWGCPVAARSAVCLPVSSMSQLLGTLWLVSSTQRLEPSSEQTNLLELVAGRIASEWERLALAQHILRHRGNGNSTVWQDADWPLLADPTLTGDLPITSSKTSVDPLPNKLPEPGKIAVSNPEKIVGRLLGDWAEAINQPFEATKHPNISHTQNRQLQPQPPFESWNLRGDWHLGTRRTNTLPQLEYSHLSQWNVSRRDTLLTWCLGANQEHEIIDTDWWQEIFHTAACFAASPTEILNAVSERYRRLDSGKPGLHIAVAEFDPVTGEFDTATTGRMSTIVVGGSSGNHKGKTKSLRRTDMSHGLLRCGQALEFSITRSRRRNAKQLRLLQIKRLNN